MYMESRSNMLEKAQNIPQLAHYFHTPDNHSHMETCKCIIACQILIYTVLIIIPHVKSQTIELLLCITLFHQFTFLDFLNRIQKFLKSPLVDKNNFLQWINLCSLKSSFSRIVKCLTLLKWDNDMIYLWHIF